MSGKLDQSLDQIMSDRKTTNPRAGKRRPARGAAQRAKAAIAAPAGGVQKTTKGAKANTKAPAVVAPTSGDSKILVTNLPNDVDEGMVKDFFNKAIGSVKRVVVAYGPNGKSRGEATVLFSKPGLAAQAQSTYHGVKIDNRPMRIEIVGVPVVAASKEKSLKDRMSAPKSAAGKKETPTGPKKVTANGTAKGKGKKSGRAGRPKPKTAEELDAEMQDYFGGAQNPDAATNGQSATNGTTQAAVGGDTGMTDEVL